MKNEGGGGGERGKKNHLSNGILHVICIFHWQMIWLPGKFDNFKWQWQLASPTPLHTPCLPFSPAQRRNYNQFSVFNFSCCCNLCIQVAAARRMMMFMIIMTMMMRQLLQLLYLVYLVSFICRMHFAVVLIVKCPSVLFLSRKQHGAHHHYAAQIINKMYISFFSRIEALYQFCSGFKRFRRRNVYTKYIY